MCRQPQALTAAKERYSAAIDLFIAEQFIFDKQWTAVKVCSEPQNIMSRSWFCCLSAQPAVYGAVYGGITSSTSQMCHGAAIGSKDRSLPRQHAWQLIILRSSGACLALEMNLCLKHFS